MPTEPTGNRWMDPDNPGKIANPGNVDLATFAGKDARALKFGPALQDNEPEAPAPVKDPEAVKQRALAKAAQVNPAAARVLDGDAKKLGRAFQEELPTPEPTPLPTPGVQPGFAAEHRELVAIITEHGPKARKGDPQATATLNRIAEDEYSREDGGRTPIVKRLAAYGIKRPEGLARPEGNP